MTNQTTEIKATFDATTPEGMMRVFNARNGASVSMKNLQDGHEIDAVAVLQYPETTTEYNQEGQTVTVTTIFAEDGTSYSSISDPVAKAASGLIDMFEALQVEKLKVKVVKGKSSRGQDFLNLQISL